MVTTISYGTRIAQVGCVEHLGSVSVDEITEIYFRPLGSRIGATATGIDAREFWQLNSGEVVEWNGKFWRGRIGKFGTLIVRVK